MLYGYARVSTTWRPGHIVEAHRARPFGACPVDSVIHEVPNSLSSRSWAYP